MQAHQVLQDPGIIYLQYNHQAYALGSWNTESSATLQSIPFPAWS